MKIFKMWLVLCFVFVVLILMGCGVGLCYSELECMEWVMYFEFNCFSWDGMVVVGSVVMNCV